MNISRTRIVAAARSWLGTSFHHQGRLKKTGDTRGGCDCIGLIMGVAAELGLKSRQGMLITELDQQTYARIPDSDYLKEMLEIHCLEISLLAVEPGDILLFQFEDNPQHLAIKTGYGIIHAYMGARKVVEHIWDQEWQTRLVAAYRMFETL